MYWIGRSRQQVIRVTHVTLLCTLFRGLDFHAHVHNYSCLDLTGGRSIAGQICWGNGHIPLAKEQGKFCWQEEFIFWVLPFITRFQDFSIPDSALGNLLLYRQIGGFLESSFYFILAVVHFTFAQLCFGEALRQSLIRGQQEPLLGPCLRRRSCAAPSVPAG